MVLLREVHDSKVGAVGRPEADLEQLAKYVGLLLLVF